MVIELNPKTVLASPVQKMGDLIIQDDSHLQSTLESVRVDQTRTIVLCTQNDTLDLQVALKARSINPAINVVRWIFDGDYARSLDEQFGFKTISTTGMASPAFAVAATSTDFTPPVTIEGGSLSLSKVCLQQNSHLIGLSAAEIERIHDVSIVLLNRFDEPDLHPTGDRIF